MCYKKQKLAVLLLIVTILSNVATASPSPFNILDLLTSDTNLQEFKQGAGQQFKAAEHASKGERGEKGYLAQHEIAKGAHGHHDKERKKNEFAEEGAKKDGYKHRDGYFAQQDGGAKGSKGYHYEDKGSYAKGHSTHGHHNVHKLDDYKKNVDFYDKDHDEAHQEKHGGYEVEKAAAVSGQKAGTHFDKGYLEGGFGIAGKYDKGEYEFDDQGHLKAQGKAQFYNKGAEFEKKGEAEAFKKFGFANKLLL